MKNLHTLLAVIIVSVTACTKEPLTVVTKASGLGKDSIFSYTNKIDKKQLLSLINNVRSKGCNCGGATMKPAAALVWNERLEKAAWLHSKEMNDSNYLSHNSQNGRDAGYRIKQMGYNWTTYTENIALGKLSEQALVEGWIASSTHCKALLNDQVTEIGIGAYGNFFTGDLATR